MCLCQKRRTLLLISSLIVLAIGFAALESAALRHRIHKIIVKTEMRISGWRGFEPRLASIGGESGLPGARVQALDSRSGWATLCDHEGKFILPDVMWYPGASYDLIVSTDDRKGRRIRVLAPQNTISPASSTSTGILEVGTLASDGGREVDLPGLPGDTSNSYEEYDLQNRDYYRALYDELTSGILCDEDKIEAVNKYVSQKLNYQETQWELGSPRRILERGSQYCGHLATAMATILAVGYPARVIHLSDGAAAHPTTHAVVEVFYATQWHLYDPTFGVNFSDKDGRVVSYRELRLNPGLINQNPFSKFREKYPKISLKWMPSVYRSGYHHMYYLWFRCSQYSHAWWDYKDGLSYVPSGGRVLAAAAGVRPGSRVTFHIRTAGSDADELAFTTQRTGNACCVVNEQESPPIDLAPGRYEVYVDLLDGNVRAEVTPASITGWRLVQRLEVR